MRSRATPTRPVHACVLAYDGLCTFEFGICVEIFGLPRPELEVPWYRYSVAGIDPGPLAAAGGITLHAGDLQPLRDADLILIPGWRDPFSPAPKRIVRHLQIAHARGARIASICSGAFLLAAAGLLRNRPATTHWRYMDALSEADPSIVIEPDVLYVDDGDIVTSAGSAAGIDMCLHIVRQDYGADVANSVARRLLLPAHRSGGQAQFVPRPVGRERGGDIAELMDTMRKSLDQSWSVHQMADAAALSPRTLLRRFRESAGLSPKAWLLRERIAFARDLLETTRAGVQVVAERAGFGSPESLRHHFRREVGVSPTAYRASFERSS